MYQRTRVHRYWHYCAWITCISEYNNLATWYIQWWWLEGRAIWQVESLSITKQVLEKTPGKLDFLSIKSLSIPIKVRDECIGTDAR